MANDNQKLNLPNSILFVDDEEDLATLMNHWFKDLDYVKLDCAHGGEQAWEVAQKFHYDFVVLDWKIDGKLDGLGLINRFRQHRYYAEIPILVISGFLSKKEFSIVDEMPFTGRLEKPLQQKAFLKAVSNLNDDCIWYNKNQQMITKSIQKCMGDDRALSQLIVKMIDKTNNPASLLSSVGKALLQLGADEKAEMVFLKALEKKPNSASLNNHLGKLCLKKGRLDDATRYLERAMLYSPNNIERLCDLGNIEMQKMELDKAVGYFDKASSIDQADESAKGGKVLTENISNWLKHQDSVPGNFASMLNSIGISMAREGSFQKCIEHYESALKHLHSPELKAKVSFNLGLAFLRWKKLAKANSWFKQALAHDPKFEKANHWVEKLSSPTDNASTNSADKAGDNVAKMEDFTEETFTSEGESYVPASESFAPEVENILSNDLASDAENFISGDDLASIPSPISSKDFVQQDDNMLNYGDDKDVFDLIDDHAKSNEPSTDDCNISDKLFTVSDRKPIPSTCLAVSKNKLEIQTTTELNEDSKVVLIVNDKGYEFDIVSNKPANTEENFGFHMILHAVDKGIDLNQILMASS